MLNPRVLSIEAYKALAFVIVFKANVPLANVRALILIKVSVADAIISEL